MAAKTTMSAFSDLVQALAHEHFCTEEKSTIYSISSSKITTDGPIVISRDSTSDGKITLAKVTIGTGWLLTEIEKQFKIFHSDIN